ncbi:unnamed protein product [Prunus armeniaca]
MPFCIVAYMKTSICSPPPSYVCKRENLVCKLHKSLYELKHASRQWFAKFSQAILDAGYIQSKADYSLLYKHKGITSVFILVYVDDVIITGSDANEISTLKNFLRQRFKLKDSGNLKYFLGIEVSRSRRGICLNQQQYALDIIKDEGLLGAKPAPFPMEENLKLNNTDGNLLNNPASYRRLIGRLIYLTVTRPYILFSVNILRQFMHQPRQPHMKAAIRLVHYLKGSPGQCILLSSHNELKLQAFYDSDWASCPMTRRSTTGYCVFLGTSPISWKTRKQPTISKSSSEAEYRAMTLATCELQWLWYLLQDLGVSHSFPSILYCDDKDAIYIAANPVYHERTKHIEIDCHVVRERIQDGTLCTAFFPSKDQIGYIFTKALGKETFLRLKSKLNLLDIHAPT